MHKSISDTLNQWFPNLFDWRLLDHWPRLPIQVTILYTERTAKPSWLGQGIGMAIENKPLLCRKEAMVKKREAIPMPEILKKGQYSSYFLP